MKERKTPSTKTKRKQHCEEYLKYQRYIKSKQFKEVRNLVLDRDNHKCRTCGYCEEDTLGDKRTLQAHHSTYKNLYNESEHLDDLITLCSTCHVAIHRKPLNFKRFKMK